MAHIDCPYCGGQAKIASGKEIYPHREDLSRLLFYRCIPCDAYVGCHKGTHNPLGRLANKNLRTLKQRAHAVFDPFWKSGRISRTEAYARMAKKLGIKESECHIGMFDEETCQKVIDICTRR